MKDFCAVCGDPESSPVHDIQFCSGEFHPFASGLCSRCDDEAGEKLGGLCRDCYNAENGPSWDYPPSAGGTEAAYRENMVGAGRGYLLG